MNKWELDQRDPVQAAYANKMAELLNSLNIEKKPPTKDQAPSTQAILARDPALDEEWQNRPLPPAQITYDQFMAANDEERMKMVNARQITPEEYSHFESRRRASKNTLGSSDEPGSTKEGRIRAAEAFYCHPPAELTFQEKEKLVKLVGYESAPIPPEKSIKGRRLKWDERLFDALRLGKPPWRKGWTSKEVDNGE